MPELSTNDFQRVAARDGNIFFNQTTNKLDVRGSFLYIALCHMDKI